MKRALILFLTVLVGIQPCFGQVGDVIFSRSHPGSGVLSLNPGWQFVQEFTPNPCNGTTCTTPADCSTVNCLVPVTVGDVVVVALISNAVNSHISSITSAGSGWTNASCQALNSGVDNIDIEYTLAATTGFQQLVANFSLSVTGAYLDIMELKPPAGHLAVFDGCAHNTPASSTTATGGAPTVTGTDAIVQFYGGLNTTPAGFNSWSGCYLGTLEGTGLCLNGSSGAAPTVSLAATATMNIDAIAFKTDAGAFTPPTPIFTIVAHSLPTSGAAKNCSPSCTLTITSTGTGHLLFLAEVDSAGAGNNSISTVTGAGTWGAITGCHKNGGTGGWEVNCFQNLSSTSGVTSLTVTFTGNVASAYFSVFEVSRTSGSFSLDASGCTLNSGSATFIPPGQPLTLANNNPHVTFQIIAAPGGTDGATFYYAPFTTGVANGTVMSTADTTASAAILPNDTVGQTPGWPFPGVTGATLTVACGASDL